MAKKHLPTCLIFLVFLGFFSSSHVNAAAIKQEIPANAEFFNTKTRYQDADPFLRENILAINVSAVKPPAPACIPIHLTAIIRHGTRFPTAGNVEKIAILDKLVKSEAKGDLSYLPELKAWKNWYTQETAGHLTAAGRGDQIHLAKRLVKTFPTLLTKSNLLNKRVKFITSSVPRCINSTLAFQQGLKESLSIPGNLFRFSYNEEFKYTVNDTLMRFFASCERLLVTVLNNKEAVVQVTLFEEGPEMSKVHQRLSDQLQIPYANITLGQCDHCHFYLIEVCAYYLCAYEFSILGLVTPWCKLFDRAEAQVMDYAGDLGLYWKRGYGHEVNYMSSCVLFHNLFNRLETSINQFKSGQPVSEVVNVQVGHAETLIPLMTLLGLFKGKISLDANNFAENLHRPFNCSKNVPFAANLMAALWSCPDGFRLQFRVNENPVALPGLSYSPLYEEVKKLYADLLQGCNEEEPPKCSLQHPL
ncbi:multiple inositol polyphosphate phosphatase 1-like [Astyanax mexicanus]|uniref:Multiple inositol polyphosphate phosphatase 1 n=1 Tax=Astyanax mexicanus TaxID=7994 RepID=A0A8T2L9W2_ASTMX|nr:multiple inositol polyphosphate phosphatase 1-like [Astyanax mexicanus]